MPFRIVAERSLDTANVIATPNMITPASSTAERIDLCPASEPIKNMEIITIRVGNRPLQGTKLFVIIAISLSRGESIIRHPITPAALQPNDMHKECHNLQ